MDKKTIEVYDTESETIAQLHSRLTPHRIYDLIKRYFLKNGTSADIGCGIGRDTHWLNQNGFHAIGVDASIGMLNQARALYPHDTFILDSLPTLKQLTHQKFDNILCSAVLMHLDKNELTLASKRLIESLNDNGCLVVSFRGTQSMGNRENGKLYEPIDIDAFLDFFNHNDCELMLHESDVETKRHLTWHNVAIKK